MKNNHFHGLKEMNEYIENEFLNDEGFGVVRINMNNNVPLFDPLSIRNQESINNQIVSYINEKTAVLNNTTSLKLIFCDRYFSEVDKEKIKDYLKEYYAVCLFKIRKKLRYNRGKCLGFSIGGVLLLIINYIINKNDAYGIKTEVISILGSFSLWEAADFFLIERKDILNELLRTKKLYDALIEFE